MQKMIKPGMKIGKLTVLEKAAPGKYGGAKWLCKCECGNDYIANETHLRNHLIGSCGCGHRVKTPDIIGKRYGRLTVKYQTVDNPYGKSQWVCQCDCGKIALKTYRALTTSSKVPSCGCYNVDRIVETHSTHGMVHTHIWGVWYGMRQRCYYPKHISYKYYGAKGITVCDRWKDSFENFYEDMGETYQEGLQLDRIDSNGPYSPDNCRWVTPTENGRNTSHNHLIATAIGNRPMSEQSEVSGISVVAISNRLKQGIPEEYSILPNLRKPGWKKGIAAIKKMYSSDSEAIWLDDETDEKVNEIIDTAEIQAKAIHEWGFSPKDIILGTTTNV